MPTRFGSLSTSAENGNEDSPSVTRLREAGAIVFAKTTLPEFAHKVSTESPLTGATHNPWNLAHTPGGSSGGAAAAVAARIGPLALGTDGGGSIRVPAAWSGIYGFKPSFGRVPHHPRGAFAFFSHVGPMTRTVTDAAAMMDAIAQPDSRDWYSLPHDSRSYVEALSMNVAGLRIALSPTLGITEIDVDPEVLHAVDIVARAFESMGAHVEPADPPAIGTALENHRTAWASLSARIVGSLSDANRSRVDPTFAALAAGAAEIDRHVLLEAIIGRGEFGHVMNGFFERFDLLLCPVYPTTAPSHERIATGGPLVPYFTPWCNQTGQPAASVPVGVSSAGLPLAAQIVGRQYADRLVLAASHALEKALPAMPAPPAV
jgi:aspartyl-tRNA(Asn)/glutamyl-tRNA(Gln) amidotransferase subunit A